ncbi:MAG: hypothetical protein U5K75_04595 [Ahrensia sp.]|nr:hypothetical protein [Ahrensia sp.]
MGDGFRTVVEPDFIEGGIYVQVLTGGVYVGWNDNGNGITVGMWSMLQKMVRQAMLSFRSLG